MAMPFAPGCGSGLAEATAARTRFTAASIDTESAELITLDWNGGVTPIYPDESFDAIDLALFETLDGGTLADDAEGFKHRVRDRIGMILNGAVSQSVRVEHAADAPRLGDTIVYLTQVLSQHGGSEVGEAEYDPCNRQHDNAAVIFGEELRDRAGTRTVDQWVNLFANVTAHEVAHTLGYAHVERPIHAATERTLYAELMLDGHTISELCQEQRLASEQAVCTDEATFVQAIFGTN